MTDRLQSWHLLTWNLHQVAWEWTISQAQPWGTKKIDAFYPHTHISDLVDKFVEMCKWSKSLRKVVDCKAWTGLDSQVQIVDHTTCIEVADSSYLFVKMWKIFITFSAPGDMNYAVVSFWSWSKSICNWNGHHKNSKIRRLLPPWWTPRTGVAKLARTPLPKGKSAGPTQLVESIQFTLIHPLWMGNAREIKCEEGHLSNHSSHP